MLHLSPSKQWLRVIILCVCSISCGNKRLDRGVFGATDPLGQLTVDLDVNTSCVRLIECPAGNLAADALQAYALSQNLATDAALMNGGGIRFNKEARPTGIYPKGDWNEALSYEMFPFNNEVTVVTLTGAQLKSTFERAAASLPNTAGSFLQVSKEISVVYDKSQPAQKISTDQATISQEGSRVASLKINGVEYQADKAYRIAANNFLAFSSESFTANDGFVELRNLPKSQKQNTGVNLTEIFAYFFPIYTPISPQTEGRVTIKN